VTIPIHWGGLFPEGFHRVWPDQLVEPPREFARFAAATGARTRVVIVAPGERAEVEGTLVDVGLADPAVG
jgi:L-ascorbate metabolism protein UlaG (beta-lactamase superfamily)